MTAVSTAQSAVGRCRSWGAAKVRTAAVGLRTHSRSSALWSALHVRSSLQPVAKWLMASSSPATLFRCHAYCSGPHAQEHRGAKRTHMLHKTNAPRCVSKHERVRHGRPHPSRRARARWNLRTRFRIRAPQAEDGHRVRNHFSRCQTAHLVPPTRFLRPGSATLASRTPNERVAERRESYGCSDTRGPALDAAGQAPCEAPCAP